MTIKIPIDEEDDEKKYKMPLYKKNRVRFNAEGGNTARIDMTGRIFDLSLPDGTPDYSTRTPSDEEDTSDDSMGNSEKISHTVRFDEETIFDLEVPYSFPPSSEEEDKNKRDKKSGGDEEATPFIIPSKEHLLKKWRIWNYEYKLVLLHVVIMFIFLGMTFHARSQLEVS
jgi:hypothetical protein